MSDPMDATAAYYEPDNNPQHNKWSKNGYGNPVQKQTGKFSREESELVRKAVKDYCAAKQISTARLCSECDHKAELKGAWMEIAKALPHRSVQSVYRHGIRQLHPFKRGAWTEEEVASLVDLVQRIGKKWSTIQGKLHRSADSCRDKYREMSEEYTKGRWKEQETELLKRLIREQVGVDQNTPMVTVGKLVEERGIQIPWSLISKRMVKRSRLSCFKKWQKLTGLFPEDGKKYKDDGEEGDMDKAGEEDMSPPVAKRAKIAEGEAAFPQAPTAGAAAALAAAASSGTSTGTSSYYELYDSAKADGIVEGECFCSAVQQCNQRWTAPKENLTHALACMIFRFGLKFTAVGLPDTDSLVPGSNKILI
eukprot:scaffold6634_cov158-Amphora_coffeaeformis.AAC.10